MSSSAVSVVFLFLLVFPRLSIGNRTEVNLHPSAWPRGSKVNSFTISLRGIEERRLKNACNSSSGASCYLWVFPPCHHMQNNWESKKTHKMEWMESSSFSVMLWQIPYDNWGTGAYCITNVAKSPIPCGAYLEYCRASYPSPGMCEPPLAESSGLLPIPLSRWGLLA